MEGGRGKAGASAKWSVLRGASSLSVGRRKEQTCVCVCVCVCVWLKARRGSSCIRLVYRGLFDRVSRGGSGLVDSGRRGAAFHQAVD